MAPKAKSTDVYVVVSTAGVDSVYGDVEHAKERVVIAKSEGQTSVRIEVHTLVGSSVTSAPASEDKKLTTSAGAGTGSATTAATPAKQTKSDAKAKDAKQPKEPKSESKPKEIKPKEAKSDSKAKAKDQSKATTDGSAAAAGGDSTASASEPKAAPSSTPAAAPALAPASAATPAKTAQPKTISAEEQRATNAKKGTKAANDDLPANVQTLLDGKSETLTGLTVVVTGVPPTIGRKNAEKLVEVHGGKLGKSITGKTNLVILGNDAGPKKLEQISEHKITTVDEDGLIKKLEAGAATGASANAGSPSKKRGAEEGLVKKGSKKTKE